MRSALAAQAKQVRAYSLNRSATNARLKEGIRGHLAANTDVSTTAAMTKKQAKQTAKQIANRAESDARAKVEMERQQRDANNTRAYQQKKFVRDQVTTLTRKAKAVRQGQIDADNKKQADISTAKYYLQAEGRYLPKVSRRKISAMSYGSPEQTAAADRYIKRLERFRARKEGTDIGYMADQARRKLLMDDVFAMANRRFYGRIDDNKYATRGTGERLGKSRRLRQARETARG